MQNVLNLGGGLLLLALLTMALSAWPALFNPIHWKRGNWKPRRWRDFFVSELGVTITYTSEFIGNGSATAPTAIQASQLQTQTATVLFADGDAQAVVTTNWGLPASFPSYLYPELIFYPVLGGVDASGIGTPFTFGLTNTNSITINKLRVGTSSGGTWNLILRRPHSTGK